VKIVAFVGKAGSGKDYMCKRLRQQYKVHQIGFADHSKIELMAREGYTFDACFVTKPEEVRTRMQQYPDEQKALFDDCMYNTTMEAWLDLLERRNHIRNFSISDCRLQIEADMIASRGGILIRLLSDRDGSVIPLTAEQKGHRTESEVDVIECDYTIDNNQRRYSLAEQEMLEICETYLFPHGLAPTL
jgi:hypothetical protein